MITINLVNKSQSEVNYNIIEFSDTQKLITFDDPKRLYLEDVMIRSRMSWGDLQLIIQTVAILRSLNASSISLLVPYVLGARSDRKFDPGGSSYLRDVIAPMLNALNLSAVYVQDPHSIVVETCINKVEANSSLNNLVNLIRSRHEINNKDYYFISPDEGAIKRTLSAAMKDRNAPRVIKCLKERDIKTGAIVSTEVLIDDLNARTCIVIDDICDGGATFLALAEDLKKKNAGDLYLCVSHGIFSKGFDELKKHYKGIATTNSVRDFTDAEREYISVHRVL